MQLDEIKKNIRKNTKKPLKLLRIMIRPENLGFKEKE